MFFSFSTLSTISFLIPFFAFLNKLFSEQNLPLQLPAAVLHVSLSARSALSDCVPLLFPSSKHFQYCLPLGKSTPYSLPALLTLSLPVALQWALAFGEGVRVCSLPFWSLARSLTANGNLRSLLAPLLQIHKLSQMPLYRQCWDLGVPVCIFLFFTSLCLWNYFRSVILRCCFSHSSIPPTFFPSPYLETSSFFLIFFPSQKGHGLPLGLVEQNQA